MAKYKVCGKVDLYVYIEIEIPDEYLEGKDEDEIEEFVIEKAHDEFGGLTNFVGNGGYDKLVGVYGSNESIEASEEIEFTEVYPVED